MHAPDSFIGTGPYISGIFQSVNQFQLKTPGNPVHPKYNNLPEGKQVFAYSFFTERTDMDYGSTVI